jgi:hypothetical protein
MRLIYPLLILCTLSMIRLIEVHATNTPQKTGFSLIATIKATNITCFGGSDGSATVTVFGGSNYIYAWSNGQKTQTITNLTVGTYNVTVTSGTQRIIASARISQPMALIGTIGITNAISCSNPTIKVLVNVNGGTMPYFYRWSTGANTSSIAVNTEGEYRVTVTDSKGCTISQAVRVSGKCIAPPLSATTKVTNVSCLGGNNGSATVTASGGTTYSYAWSNGQKTQTATNLVAGTYTVTVTSGTQTKTVTATVLQPISGLTGLITAPYTLSCALPTVNIYATASGGNAPYTYNWSTGGSSHFITVNTEGGYRVTITDSKGCAVTQAVRVSGSCRYLYNVRANENDNNTHDHYDIEKAANLTLSPNPTSDQFNLVYQFPTASDAFIEVKSASGRIVERHILRGATAGRLSFETDNWPVGLYFISLQNNKTTQTKMLMVLH